MSEKLLEKIKTFPDLPGVYVFKNEKGDPIYIGKATSLRDRAKSYFSKDLMLARGPLLVKMIEEAGSVEFVQTDSVLEALVSEAQYIKKYKPIYNTREKDDKSFNFVVITKEKFPQLLVKRGREIEFESSQNDKKYMAVFGPFTQGASLREALKIIRRIFPYRDHKCTPAEEQKGEPRACFSYHIGLCPGPCAGVISSLEYKKTVRNLILFFEGKKKQLQKNIEKEMKISAKNMNFEEANRLKRTLFALNHIQDVSLIKHDNMPRSLSSSDFRIEAYDIAHLAGSSVVGVMTVVENGEPVKAEYRKFRIRVQKNNDIAGLKEVLHRRFTHPEWTMPSLIVVDGGVAQKNAAESVLEEIGVGIPVVSVTKNEFHKPEKILGEEKYANAHETSILVGNSEAHRFAINYHRQSLRKRKLG